MLLYLLRALCHTTSLDYELVDKDNGNNSMTVPYSAWVHLKSVTMKLFPVFMETYREELCSDVQQSSKRRLEATKIVEIVGSYLSSYASEFSLVAEYVYFVENGAIKPETNPSRLFSFVHKELYDEIDFFYDRLFLWLTTTSTENVDLFVKETETSQLEKLYDSFLANYHLRRTRETMYTQIALSTGKDRAVFFHKTYAYSVFSALFPFKYVRLPEELESFKELVSREGVDAITVTLLVVTTDIEDFVIPDRVTIRNIVLSGTLMHYGTKNTISVQNCFLNVVNNLRTSLVRCETLYVYKGYCTLEVEVLSLERLVLVSCTKVNLRLKKDTKISELEVRSCTNVFLDEIDLTDAKSIVLKNNTTFINVPVIATVKTLSILNCMPIQLFKWNLEKLTELCINYTGKKDKFLKETSLNESVYQSPLVFLDTWNDSLSLPSAASTKWNLRVLIISNYTSPITINYPTLCVLRINNSKSVFVDPQCSAVVKNVHIQSSNVQFGTTARSSIEVLEIVESEAAKTNAVELYVDLYGCALPLLREMSISLQSVERLMDIKLPKDVSKEAVRRITYKADASS